MSLNVLLQFMMKEHFVTRTDATKLSNNGLTSEVQDLKIFRLT